jgi:hypothetical protein
MLLNCIFFHLFLFLKSALKYFKKNNKKISFFKMIISTGGGGAGTRSPLGARVGGNCNA